MADISKIKLPDETEVNLKDAQAFANIENDGQGGSSYTITRRDGTTKQVTIPNVTTTDPGLMTASDKIKIDTIEQGAEVNQQAFSKIRITKGSAHTDLDADTKTDTLELIEGDNITLTPSAVSDAVTIHAKDTVYTLAQDETDGHIIILTNNDEGSTDHVQTITIPDNNTTYTVSLDSITNEIILTDSFGNTTKAKPNNASPSLDGFMSKSDKSKLDGIASGAEVNQNAFSNVKVDDTTISADSKTDTLTFIAGSNITITPNATNDSITIASSYTNTTYELSQDSTDGHKFTLTGSNGYTKTITIPDNNTTYTLSVGTGTDANQIVFTPSSGSATKITVPYATKALQDADGNVIKDTYAASFSISGHTITLKNKSGVSLGTVTVPDNNTTYTFAEGTTNKAFSVTPSGGSAQTVPIHGLGSASEKNFTTSVTSGSADLVTSGAVASAISTAIDNLPEPMIFKGTLGTNGTITSLPTASSSNEGWTYKVITAGTYASQAAKVGDMFVSAKIGSAYQWVYVPSGDDVEDTWRNIKVNGTEKLGTGISSGAVDFVDGDFINITYANNKITVSHADTSSQASVSNSGRTYIQSVTLDGAGHVTKLTSATETVVNTDRYVNSASFADDTTASVNSPVKMTLTRAGSDTATVTANIPKVSASSAGVAPKGASVSSQSQSTKFLREDGTWSAPSYTVNTDTKVTSVGNHYTPTADSSAQLSASASGGTAAWSIDVVQGVQLQRDAKGHVVGVTVTSGKIPGNPNTNYYHKTGSWNGLTYTAGKVGSPDDLAFTIPTGTSATTVAVGNHTHSTTIATSTGTNQLTLSHGGKYAITTGGTSFVFTMPTDNNTDTNVTQTATNTNANYEVLFSGTADNTTRTEGARKYSNLTFNPSTGTLTTTKVVSANATLGVADIDTANITEDNVGNLIVTGAARFLNTINGSISGNAATASDSAKLNGYASDTSATNNTIARRTANGYIFATYFNQSSGAETPTSSSYIIYANNDGYFRKSTVANMKTAMSLNNVENKSSATIRGELTSANVTTALGYTPVNKAGDTMSGELHFTSSAPLVYDWVHTTESPMIVLKGSPNYGIRYQEGDPDTMKFSASGNANTNNADLCINGAGDGTVTIRGNTIIHAGNYTSYTVKKDGTGASGTWGISISGNAATATTASSANSVAWGNVSGKPTKLSQFTNDITFATSIASSTDTSEITLAHNGVYTLTAGGTSFVFKMPSSGNTDTKVRQTLVTNTDNTNRPLLLAYSNTSTTTGNVDNISYRANTIYANASTGTITATKFVGDLDGNADTATKATQDSNGDVITSTYLPLKTNSGIKTCSGGGKYTWFRIATLKITGGYSNGPIVFEVSQRQYQFTTLQVCFANDSSADPELSYFVTNYTDNYYISKTDTSTWELYGKYSEPWGGCSLHRISGYRYDFGVTVTVDMVNIEAGPTDFTRATYGGNVGYAISAGSAGFAGSATKATQDSDGNAINSTYLKLAGGTMTGVLTLKGGMYEDAYNGALNANNSDIYNLNSIYTADSSGGASEGIHFYRDTTHVDTLWVNDGDLLFVPNRELGVTTSKANSQKVGRFTANPTSGQVVITDGTTGGMKSSGYTIAKSVPSDALFTDHTYNFSGTTFYSGNQNNSEHNADNIQYNGLYYYTSNGPATSIGASTADGAIYAQAHSTSWVSQIAQDYRDGSLFVRGKNNGTWQNWLAVLDAGNIGYNMTSTVKYDPHNRRFITSKSTSAWDAQAYSQSGYVDNVFVTFKPNQTNMALMVGLDANPSQDASYGNIDYCWYVHNDAKLTMFESGTERSSISGHTTYVAGDELRVEYSGGYIRYYHNGVLCREIARAISGKLYMDSTFHGASSCIYDVEFGCTATNANYAASAGKATQDSDGNAINSTYLKKSGGTMTGQLYTSFKSAVAMGSRASDATTIPDLCEDLRYSSGCCGSVSIGTAYTLNNITIAKGWYNYLWVPHRSGGNSGAASGDNCNYGSLYLSGMTLSGCYMIRYASAAIAELHNLYADNNTTYGLGTSGNNITIVAGGTTTSITAPYATSAGSATNDSSGNQISTTYVKKSGDSMTGALCMNSANGNYGEGIRINAGSNGYSSLTIGTETNSTGGISDCGFWIGTNRTNASYQRKLYIAHNASTASTTYFYASSASDQSPSLQVGGAIVGRGVVCANAANSSTAGGLSLYGTDPNTYGVIFRGTSNQGKHGYVTSDWATYFTMSNTNNRGWVFRRQGSGNVASIDTSGQMVLNGSLTLGGNEANTSGCRLVYSSLGSLDFVFV